MKMGWVTIQSNNMEESLQFYQGVLGLTINNHLKLESMELVFLDAGDVEIEIIYHEREHPVQISNGVSVGLEIDDIGNWLVKLRDFGYDINEDHVIDLEDMSFFFIKDPSGLNIQLYKFKEK